MAALSGFFGLTHALDMCPEEPDGGGYKSEFDDEMEAVKPLVKARVRMPGFAKAHPYISECVTPRPGTDESVDVKTELRHAGDARGKCDEGADDGKKPAEKYGDATVLLKKTGDAVEVVRAHQDPATIAQH